MVEVVVLRGPECGPPFFCYGVGFEVGNCWGLFRGEDFLGRYF